MYTTLFEIGPFTIYSLWIFIVIAFFVSTHLFLKRAKYERLDLRLVVDHSLSLLLGTVLASRIIFFISNWGFFGPLTFTTFLKQTFYFWEPGYSFWGALFGFSAVFLFHARRKNENPIEWVNIALVPIFIGIMIGNLGQLLEGQAYGKETSLPWGISFETTNVKYTVPVHPTQIYSILLIAAILLTHKKVSEKWHALKDRTNWTLFALTVYSGGRFLIECLRGDDTLQIGFLRIGHIASLIAFVGFGYLLYKRTRKN